jgi:ABC-type glycerol-3-phosphate transport system substrate-binding protein
MPKSRRITRRNALKIGAASAALPLVHIRTAGAAGKLAIAFEDHWVPAGSAKTREQVEAWAEKNKVDVTIDFITSVGSKIQLTMAAEAQAGAGHDVMAFDMWNVQNHAAKLEPVDDVVNYLIGKYGEVSKGTRYLGMTEGHWMAVPTTNGHALLVPCARISLMKKLANIDVQAMYPAHQTPAPEAANWTYDTFLKAAEACHKGGHPFGLGMGVMTDSVQTWGTIFAAHGAQLVDAKGNVTVDSDGVHAALEYAKKLIPFLPPDSVSYDDASNNRALISGKSAMIWNPPSAWAVAKRDAPQVAADCWTFPNPAGPKGRFIPDRPYFWGVWAFSNNKTAGKDLIKYLLERPQVEAREVAVSGYDIPPYSGMMDFPIWAEVEPPKGTVYNYPVRPWHGSTPWIAGDPAPQSIAVQMYNRGTMPGMAAKLSSGQSIKQVIAWAKDELEGFTR